MSDQNSANPRFQFFGQHMLNTPVSPGQIDAGWLNGGSVDPRQLSPEQLQALIPYLQQNAEVLGAHNPDSIGPNYWDDQIGGVADAMAAQNNPMDPSGQEEMARQRLTAERKPGYINALIQALSGGR